LLLAHDGGPFELTEPAAIQRSLPSAKEGDVSSNEWDSLLDVCRRAMADVVVVQNGDRSGTSPSPDDIMQCLSRGLEVVDAPTFLEKYFGKVLAKSIDASWLVSAHLHVCRPALVALKRAFDVAAALVGLAMTLPFWPILGLLVKLTSRGSVFYRQTRIGLFGKPFTIYKFRTMEADAEKAGRPQWAVPGDPRVTPLGRILRRTRIDEVPQFWNILKGDMSLIGPRPERPEFVADFARKMIGYQWRHLVRPGVTGWAQINYRYGSSEEDVWEKLSYDLYYVKNFSAALDGYIFLRTVGTLFRGSR
jgi:exopolysaccharide biosynthesis polyprenyl glycosylphosphotransferase